MAMPSIDITIHCKVLNLKDISRDAKVMILKSNNVFF